MVSLPAIILHRQENFVSDRVCLKFLAFTKIALLLQR